MDSLELLKQLKKIEPDPRFSRESKVVILSSPARISYSPLKVILRGMESSLAIALGGALLLILLGGISIFKFLTPDQTASLNFNNIRAEAQEVDVQIKLATINYSLSVLNVSSVKKSGKPSSTSVSELNAQEPDMSVSGATTSLEIESALKKLSK